MAPQDKQERRLARQRGAGPRELKNAAFNFNFGGPTLLPPQLSSRKTPQPRKSSPQKTPQPRSTAGKRKRPSSNHIPSGSRARIVASTPAPITSRGDEDELAQDTPVAIDESELPQLRRVSIPIIPHNKVSPRPPPSPDRRPPREERGRSRTRKSIVSVSDSLSRARLDSLQEEDELEDATTGAEFITDVATDTPRATPSSTRRTSSRKGSRRRRRTSGTATFDGGTSAFFRTQAAQSTRREVFEPHDDQETQVGAEDELTPEPMRVSKPRRSDVEILPDADLDKRASEDEDEDELSPQQDATLDNTTTSIRTPLGDRSTNTIRSRQRPEKSIQSPEPELESEVYKEATEPARKRQKTTSTTRPPKTKYTGPTIPITIYRRSKLADDDPLGNSVDGPIPSLHPTDVLSQITTEVINGYISSVPASFSRTHGSTSNQSTASKQKQKKTMRYQMQALQQFRDNLADSLRQVTFAQMGYWKVRGDVLRERRKKRMLREELMGRRRDREEVEREIDAVRAEHIKAEREHDKRRELVDDIEAIERAVRSGKEMAHGEVELGRNMVVDIGEVAERLGVLSRVKELNSFLGRTAETF